ncbi:MAG: glycosyl transferase [Leptolyngbya sp. UWPOB_LEPTO1]|uniref:glycosyl transferase n=1 Tax=Leptolyngbya sp. UWPOB_LEPTO1 TaxID=2815653 RepID=UPI001AC02702|nr:glycosyl transferase [Leptolyngbya sp. UWPOB_LEPTO1]MBN8559700.1 glycosyl transferase [Leptolyngbya sp. UWPOB_LEPTO1]
MPQPILYLAITNHGFGHATRAAAIAAEIQRLDPEIVLILATTAPRSVLEAYIPGNFIHRPRALDVGIIQQDSLIMDKPATLEKLREIRSRQQATIASEANFILQNKAGLVLGDIPPLAAPIAKAAGVPGWMMSNFGWDFIYRDWGGEFLEMADWISDCFSQCDRLFRMPFHESMQAFPTVTDVGLTGVAPRFEAAEVLAKFNLTDTPKEKIILVTFGGLGLDRVPYENLTHLSDYQFLCFDNNAPDLPNLIKVDDRFYRPIDLMPICGRLLSKPGYSTFSEACRYEIPVMTVTREGFAESPILLEGIQDYAEHQIWSLDEFFNGDWINIRQPMNPPRKSEKLPKDGNLTIAQAVVDYLRS